MKSLLGFLVVLLPHPEPLLLLLLLYSFLKALNGRGLNNDNKDNSHPELLFFPGPLLLLLTKPCAVFCISSWTTFSAMFNSLTPE